MELLEKYLQQKKIEAEAQKKLKELKKQIQAEFGMGEFEVDGVKVTRSSRIRIDLDKERALMKLGQEAYMDCEKATEYEVITVKRV